jgi:twinkle protein
MPQQISKEAILRHFQGKFHVFYGRYVELRRRTGFIKIPSPFREEAIGSFQIHLTGKYAGRWHDFGTGEHGDIFSFYMKINHIIASQFSSALDRIVKDFNLDPARLRAAPQSPKNGQVVSIGQFAKQDEKHLSFSMEWLKPLNKDLMDNKHGALDYLLGRGLSRETIIAFRLGVDESVTKSGKSPCIVIPHIIGSRVALVKKRSIVKKEYLRMKDMQSVLFNQDAIEDSDDVFICEGEFDAMILWQCGYKAAIAGTTGAGSFQTDWVNQLANTKSIIIGYDADAAGKEGSRTLAKRLGEERVKIIRIPAATYGEEVKDINQVYLYGGQEEIDRLVRTAQPLPIDNVQSFVGAAEELAEFLEKGGDLDDGYDWPFQQMTDKFGRMVPGYLIELSGKPGYGKTSLATQVATYLAGTENLPSLVCCLEMTPKQLCLFSIQQSASMSEEQISPEFLRMYTDKIAEWPLFFQWHDENVTIDDVIDTFTMAYKRFGVRFFVLDNLHILARVSDNEIAEQGRISRSLKLWAVRYDAVVLLIVHPRKIEEGRLESLSDIRGSGAIAGDADVALGIWRQSLAPTTEEELLETEEGPNVIFHPVTCIMATKGRFGSAGRVWLYHDGEKRSFRRLIATDELPKIRKRVPQKRNTYS